MNIDPDILPPSARELARVIGLAALDRLVAWRGGRRIWVPEKLTIRHPLALAIGHSAADKLVAYARASQLEVPLCATGVRFAREGEIRQRYAAGETAGELASEFGCTERTVWNIVSRAQVDEPRRQRELFAQD